MKSVYLAGGITGMSYEGSTDWREYAIKYLSDHGIKGISPMRCKEYLIREKVIRDTYDQHILSTAKGITTHSRWDAHRCDVTLVHFLGAERVSIGSVMEIAWASAAGRPIVCCMEDGNIHNHAMIEQTCGFVVNSLEKGLEVVTALLV